MSDEISCGSISLYMTLAVGGMLDTNSLAHLNEIEGFHVYTCERKHFVFMQ